MRYLAGEFAGFYVTAQRKAGPSRIRMVPERSFSCLLYTSSWTVVTNRPGWLWSPSANRAFPSLCRKRTWGSRMPRTWECKRHGRLGSPSSTMTMNGYRGNWNSSLTPRNIRRSRTRSSHAEYLLATNLTSSIGLDAFLSPAKRLASISSVLVHHSLARAWSSTLLS